MESRQVALHWHFNRAASRMSPHRIVFVYESSFPHLRVTWEWTVRAARGPIEHQIRIENLVSKKIWLPLQDSFRFDWQVAPHTVLEHVYIDKGADTPSSVGTHEVMLRDGYGWQGISSTYARRQG
jgi:hypothetical protein